MGQVGLRLHPDKTKVVYYKDGNRRGTHEHTSFTFLGFTFRARKARNKAGRNFAYLVRWTRKKYKRLRPFHKALACWQRITRQYPRLFAHWHGPAAW